MIDIEVIIFAYIAIKENHDMLDIAISVEDV